MLAQALSAALQRRGIHYAWVVAAVTFLTMLTTSAALGLPGAMLKPLCAEFGWNPAQVSSALAVRFVLFGLLGPFAALFIARWGLRWVVSLALLLVGASMAAVTGVGSLPGLVGSWGLVLGVGSGMTAMVLGAIVANRWFDARRGLVLGMLSASAATGQLLFLPVAAWLIEQHGWRAAVLPSVVACAVVAVLAFGLLRDRPEDLGLAPYGAATAPTGPTSAPQPMPWRAPIDVLAAASRHPTFWILAGSFFICGLSTNGLIQTHFITMCGDFGLAPVPAASVLAAMGAFDLVGTIGSGWLSDRFDNRKLLLAYYGLRGLSLMWLPHSGFTLYGLSAFAMFYGLDWIATVPPTVKLSAGILDREKAGMVFGWIFAAHQLGAATAAYGAGSVRTVLLTYTPALYAAGTACLIAALAGLLIPRAQKAVVAAPEARPVA